jgi:hypothetical protein
VGLAVVAVAGALAFAVAYTYQYSIINLNLVTFTWWGGIGNDMSTFWLDQVVRQAGVWWTSVRKIADISLHRPYAPARGTTMAKTEP